MSAWERLTPETAPAVLAENRRECLDLAEFEARQFLDACEWMDTAERARQLTRILDYIGAKIDRAHERVLYRVNGGAIQ